MMKDFKHSDGDNVERLQKMVGLAEAYTKRVTEENTLTKEELKTRYVGKVDPKKHLAELGKITIEENIVGTLMEMVDKEASYMGNVEVGGAVRRVTEVVDQMDTDDVL